MSVSERLSSSAAIGLFVFAACSSTKQGAWEPPEPMAAAAAPAASEKVVDPGAARPKKLTVHAAVQEALRFGRPVLISRAQARIAKETERQARAGLLPTVTAGFRYNRLEQAPTAIVPALGVSFPTGPRDTRTFDVAADFPLFAFGRYYYAFRSAQSARKAAQADRAAAESDIGEAVTAAAFDLLETIQLVEVARATEKALAEQVRIAREQLNAGRVTRAAVLEAEVEYADAKRDREKQESLIRIRRMVLNSLLGRPVNDPIQIEDVVETSEPSFDLMGLQEEAVARRPELRAARLRWEAARRNLRAVWGSELPEVRGTVGYSATSNEFQNPRDQASLAVTVQIPIWRGGARGARIREARRDIEIAFLAWKDLEARLRTEVAQILREVEETFRDIEVARASVEKSEESLRIQVQKFENGRATNREVLDSTALLEGERISFVRARYAYNVALQRLHRARGADPRVPPVTRLATSAETRGDKPAPR